MIILESSVSKAIRNRDFGMVEAHVTLFAKTIAGQPPHNVVVRTHVPVRGGNLRARLIADAIGLARHVTAKGKHATRANHTNGAIAA